MNLRANHRTLVLDASITLLSLAAVVYFSVTAQLFSSGISIVLALMAARHLLNDWQALQITPLQLSLRATRNSWRVDTIALSLLLTAAVTCVLSNKPPILLGLTLATAVLTARHWLNGYESLHNTRHGERFEATLQEQGI
ncbi:hypothetical protein [Chitinilyticum aquatile]|uniref:hypothetical protein n=1 Tax=Chitinilyticum aquatile TaxID=362520 RepID=UPI0004225944|nr:hypothetical protein [Chitinilyticum aquatile]